MSDRPISDKADAGGMEPVLEARNVARSYYDGTRVLQVLRDVNLQVQRGEAVSIVGASGAGKSTLLHLLGALDRATSGTILLNGADISKLNGVQLAELRNTSIGFVFQFHHLLAEFTALENVIMPGLILREEVSQLRRRAIDMLESLGLGDRLTHRPAKLSGGEQQRVSLARALINNPLLILADEPTGNLDVESAGTVIDLLWEKTKASGRSLVIVTHEPEIAHRADRCLRLRDGKLIPEE